MPHGAKAVRRSMQLADAEHRLWVERLRAVSFRCARERILEVHERRVRLRLFFGLHEIRDVVPLADRGRRRLGSRRRAAGNVWPDLVSELRNSVDAWVLHLAEQLRLRRDILPRLWLASRLRRAHKMNVARGGIKRLAGGR